MLGAMSVVLAMSPIGRIPVPWTGLNATTMHIPAIIGAILEGPAVGAGVGLIFGLYSFTSSGLFFVDPLVSVLPRLLIGVVAAYVYRKTRSAAWAAVAGTATNTIGVLGMATLRGYLKPGPTAVVAVTHGIPEIVLATIIVVLFNNKVGASLRSREANR
jgi:uncharacterized membrane protein